jgi:hypothetical protein
VVKAPNTQTTRLRFQCASARGGGLGQVMAAPTCTEYAHGSSQTAIKKIHVFYGADSRQEYL